MSNTKTRHSIHGIPTSVTERRVGNVGLLIIQAAKQGSKDNLEFLLNLPGGKYMLLNSSSSRYNLYLVDLCMHSSKGYKPLIAAYQVVQSNVYLSPLSALIYSCFLFVFSLQPNKASISQINTTR